MNPRLFLLLLGLIALFTARLHGAAFDAFLEIEGIRGESEDREFKGTIEIHSFSWGCSNPTASPTEPGKVVFTELRSTAAPGKSSPKLMESCALGTHVELAILHVRILRDPTKPPVRVRYELENVIISSYSLQGGSANADTVPTDSFSLNFSKVRFSHTAEDGTVTIGIAQRSTNLTTP